MKFFTPNLFVALSLVAVGVFIVTGLRRRGVVGEPRSKNERVSR